jgi:GrpB-like predicted nucleotidyltransferase (UPF0157 family)/GNAT superfamily N-acetyltransferase
MLRTIEVVPYNPLWPQMFEAEAALIQKAMGENCIAVHHIGSTSIPGMSAKPIIDMMPVVRDIQKVEAGPMEALGYEAKGEYGMAFRRYFQTSDRHVHVYEEGDPEIDRYLKFREWMRSHPDDAKAYAELKVELAAKFTHDILGYCNGKDAFVASIDQKDGYDGWHMVQALMNREWAAVRRLRQDCFFKSNPDPYTWTFDKKDHIHFVFYKNTDIIGYAHLQLWPHHRAALRIIAIDERYRNRGYGILFLKQCERWLSHQGYKKLLVQASKTAYPFYAKNGYTEMPFDDPDGHPTDPNDTGMGKVIGSRR